MVQTLVEMHGGQVTVVSEGLGKGSEFTVTLPVCSDMPAVVPAPDRHGDTRHCRILVIEDNIDGNKILNFCLTLEGHTVDSAFDGNEGLAKARQGRYDVVICDIGLPGLDGYEVMSQMRAESRGSELFCIAMTGYDQPTFRERAGAAGFNHYLVKPVAINELLGLLAKNFPSIKPL